MGQPVPPAPTRKLTFGDQIDGVAGESIGQEQELVVGDPFVLLFDRLDQIRRQRSAQSTGIEAGSFDREDEFARRPAMIVPPSPDAEPVRANERRVLGVGFVLLCRPAVRQSILLKDASV